MVTVQSLQDVLDRYPSLTRDEERALTNLYNTLVAAGQWQYLMDLWLFGLTETNSHISAIESTLLPYGNVSHQYIDGIRFEEDFAYGDARRISSALRQALIASYGSPGLAIGAWVHDVVDDGKDFFVGGNLSSGGGVQINLGSLSDIGGAGFFCGQDAPIVAFPESGNPVSGHFFGAFGGGSQYGGTDDWLGYLNGELAGGTNPTAQEAWSNLPLFVNGAALNAFTNYQGKVCRFEFFYLGSDQLDPVMMNSALEQFRKDLMPAIPLEVAGLRSESTVTAVDLQRRVQLTAESLSAATRVENVNPGHRKTLAVESLRSATAIDDVDPVSDKPLDVSDVRSASRMDSVDLVVRHQLAVEDMGSASRIDEVSLSSNIKLNVQSMRSRTLIHTRFPDTFCGDPLRIESRTPTFRIRSACAAD